jgi:hypothetical protein
VWSRRNESVDESFIPSVLALLATTPLLWLSLSTMLPPAVLERPAADGEWSASACLSHLVDTERYVFPARVRAILDGRDLPAFDPERQGSNPDETGPAAMAAEFAERRRQSLALIGALGAQDLERTAIHAELGPVSLRQLLNEWAAHDLNHTVQAERSIMQPFIAACGAWQLYFSDHDLSGRK